MSVHKVTIVVFFLVLAWASRADASEPCPDAAVVAALESLGDAIEMIRDDAPEDRERLGNTISEFLQGHADILYASRIILEDNWKIASPDQQLGVNAALGNRAIDLLSDVVLDVRYDLIKVEHLYGSADNPRGKVRIVVPMQDNSIVKLDLKLHSRRGDWRIFDVVAEGMSFVDNYRAQFRAQVAGYGLDDAIERFIAISQ